MKPFRLTASRGGLALFVLAAGLAGCPHGPCVLPDAGSCVTASDCTVAYCADQPCGGCFHAPVAKTQLEFPATTCLLEVGTTAPAQCGEAHLNLCNCPLESACTPACVSGRCSCGP